MARTSVPSSWRRTIRGRCRCSNSTTAFVAECTAITEYLDALDGELTLTGRTPCEKGLIHRMDERAEIESLDAISVYFRHATPGLGPDAERDQNGE